MALHAKSFVLVIDLYICDAKAPGLVGICFQLLLCITDLLNQSTHTHFKKRLIKPYTFIYPKTYWAC